MEIVVIALGVLLISFGATSMLARPDALLLALDRPNERSLHVRPTPRTGGIAINGAIAIGWLLLSVFRQVPDFFPAVCIGALVVMAVSLMDDLYGLNPLLRLTSHLAGAGIVLSAGLVPEQLGYPGGVWIWPPAMAYLMAGLLIVWMINLYNFMDGMDGFAGGMAVVGFGTLSLLGWIGGAAEFAGVSLVVAAAAGGFLAINFPPARIFMGDSGSATLGFLAAALSLWGISEEVFQFWVPMLVFSPFVVDATITLIRRAAQGERLWMAHCSHYYQRLVRMGWGHRRTVLAEYILMTSCAVSVFIADYAQPVWQWAMLVFWVVVYGGVALAIRRMERTRSEATHA